MISLRKTKDIRRVFKEGRTLKAANFLFKGVRNNLTISRFAFVVGLNVSKKANQRNRLKRRMREIVRINLSFIPPGFDIIITALPGAASKDFKEIETAIKKLLYGFFN